MSEPTVDPSAAEREPELPCDNLSPHRGHRYVRLPGIYYICPGQVWTPSRDAEFAFVTTPEGGMTPETVSWVSRPDGSGLHRAGQAAEMTDDEANEEFDGLPVSMIDDGPVCDASCCAGREVPWPDALNPHLPQPGYTPRPYGQGPERRTVSVEVLTDELRALANAEREAEAAQFRRDDPDLVPASACVGVIFRVNGSATGVPYVNTDWSYELPAHGFASLLKQAQGIADQDAAELLMPTPDVLAALDGRPDAQLLTAPVHVLAMDIKAGMLLRSTDDDGDGAETLELVTAERDCDDPECIQGATCIVLTVGGHEDPDVHFNGYSRIEVRIPVGVTS